MLDIIAVLKIIAGVLTIATGLLSLIKPTEVYGFTGLRAEGSGVSLRYGPFWVRCSLRWEPLYCFTACQKHIACWGSCIWVLPWSCWFPCLSITPLSVRISSAW